MFKYNVNINQTDYWCNLNAIAESAEAVLLQARPQPRHHRLDSWDCLPCPHPPQPVHVCTDCPAPSLTVNPSPKLRNGGFSFFCHFSFENASTCLYIYSIYNITYLQYLLIIYLDTYWDSSVWRRGDRYTWHPTLGGSWAVSCYCELLHLHL